MSQRPNYEQLYGVGLLDDLHNYFPALLYDSGSFQTVQDVLQYASLQTRRRFDLFSYGLSAYEMNRGMASGSAVNQVVPDYQFYQVPGPIAAARQTPLGGSPIYEPTRYPVQRTQTQNQPQTQTQTQNQQQNQQQTQQQTQNQPQIQRRPRHVQYVVDFEEEEQYNRQPHLSTAMLTALFAGLHPATPTELSALADLVIRLGTTDTAQRLLPVVVRPNQEQITRATEIISPETEQDCAICQDTISVTQQCRKILHCGHGFHKDCIDPWFQQNVQCPVCRFDIREHENQVLNPED